MDHSHVHRLGQFFARHHDSFAYIGVVRTFGIASAAALARSIPDSRVASLIVVLLPLMAYALFLVVARPMRSRTLLNIELSTTALLAVAAIVKYSFPDMSASAQTGALSVVLGGMLYVAVLHLLLFKATFAIWQRRLLTELSKDSGLVGGVARGLLGAQHRVSLACEWIATRALSRRIHPAPFAWTIPEPDRSSSWFRRRTARVAPEDVQAEPQPGVVPKNKVSDVHAEQLAVVFRELQRVLDEYTRECLAIKVGCAACAPMTSSSGQLCANAEPASTESTSGAICLSFI